MPRKAVLLAAALAIGLGAGACGGGSDAGEGATTALPGARADAGPAIVEGLSRTVRQLDGAALAADALEPGPLGELLGDAGYRGGVEDEYSGRTDEFAHVVHRQLEFETDEGAASYVAWLRGNASDLLGTARPARDLGIGANGFLTRDDGCGCHSDLPTYLAAWQDGPRVTSLLADGLGVDRARFLELARELG